MRSSATGYRSFCRTACRHLTGAQIIEHGRRDAGVCGSEGTSGRGSRVGRRVRVDAVVVVHVRRAEVEQRRHVGN